MTTKYIQEFSWRLQRPNKNKNPLNNAADLKLKKINVSKTLKEIIFCSSNNTKWNLGLIRSCNEIIITEIKCLTKWKSNRSLTGSWGPCHSLGSLNFGHPQRMPSLMLSDVQWLYQLRSRPPYSQIRNDFNRDLKLQPDTHFINT